MNFQTRSKEDIIQSWQIKALELEQSVLKFLDGVIADYGLYIFMGLAFLLIPILAWVLSGGLRRKLLKGKPRYHAASKAFSRTGSNGKARNVYL